MLQVARQQVEFQRFAEQNQRKFTALRQHQRQPECRPRRQQQPARQRKQDRRLDEDQARHEEGDRHPVRPDLLGLQQHADGHEEEAQQQPAERLNLGRHLMPERGVGEQDARQQGSQRHRQAGPMGGKRRHDDDEQRQGGEDLTHPRRGDDVHERPQRQPADSEDQHGGDHGLEQALAQGCADILGIAPQARQHDQQRADGEILEHQDAENAAAEAAAEFPAFHQQRQHDGRG